MNDYTDAHKHMDWLHRHVKQKEARHKEHKLELHLHEIPEQAKLIYGEKIRKGNEETF